MVASTASPRPIRRDVLPISARPSTAGGTQDLVTAAQAAMDEAVDRFASYADSGVPTFGGECAVWWVRSIQPWRDGDPQFDSAATASASVAAATAEANTEIMGTHIDPVGPIEWGSNTDSVGSRRRGESGPMRTRGDGSARLRVLPTLLGVRPHARASGLFVLRGEYEHDPSGRCYFQAQVVRFWRGDCRRCCFQAASPLWDVPHWRRPSVRDHYAALET